MKSKTPFILVLIGGILGFIGGLMNVAWYISSKQFPTNFGGMFGGMYSTYGLIMIIAHIIFAIVFIIYSIKVLKNATKTDFIIITLLAIAGFLFAGMFFSGVIIMIGSIIGWIKIGKEK